MFHQIPCCRNQNISRDGITCIHTTRHCLNWQPFVLESLKGIRAEEDYYYFIHHCNSVSTPFLFWSGRHLLLSFFLVFLSEGGIWSSLWKRVGFWIDRISISAEKDDEETFNGCYSGQQVPDSFSMNNWWHFFFYFKRKCLESSDVVTLARLPASCLALN